MIENKSPNYSAKEIVKLPEATLDNYVQRKSNEICQVLNELGSDIETYKAKGASTAELSSWDKVKNFLSGGSYKNGEDIKQIISHIEDMRDESGSLMLRLMLFMRDTVSLVCSSTRIATKMNQALRAIMVNGFTDANGNIQKLNSEADGYLNYIMGEIESYYVNQQIIDDRMTNLESLISAIENEKAIQEGKIEKNSKDIEQLVEKESKQDEQLAERIKKDESQDKELKRQAEKDKEHDDKIKEGIIKDAKQDELIQQGIEKDNLQDEELKQQFEKDVEHDTKLDEHEQLIAEMREQINQLLIENKRIRRKQRSSRLRRK